ncbi:acyl-CoA thioesterase [Qaidamihabitans albus]|uniref:acyl-CoA thioesterase n=1 Tax=Qaidamihabitans albus TaxID=2795733 RepID=UPI0018F21E39|nr:acyl-CoA thioesterase II [Qaidamihabitans albus]
MTEMSIGEVLTVLDLRRTSPDTFVGVSQQLPGLRVFGGQLLGQSIVAADRTVRPDAGIHSLHAYFLRQGDPAEPIHFTVDRTRDGRSFAARRVEAAQHGKVIFTMLASFQEPADGPSHQDGPPPVPAPENLQLRYPFGSPGGPLVMCPVPREETTPADGRARSATWIRVADDLPDTPLLHTAMLAYLSDFSILHAAMRAHSIRRNGRRAKTASLDHAMWFHRNARLDDWVLYDTVSPAAGGARAFGVGSLFSRSGELLATVGQEGMVRLLD